MDKDLSELIQYLDGRFNKVEAKLETLENGFTELQESVDSYAKKADTYFQEMVVLAHKVERLEKWLQKVAEKVGVKLEY